MTLLQIVPVRVHGDNTYVDTFAILDSGAQTSLCTDRLAEKLQLTGEVRPLSLNNVEGSGPQRMAMKTSVKLTALAEDSETRSVTVNEVWTVPRLNVPVPQLSSSARSKWLHLNGLDIADVGADQVEVLLGVNVIEAILQKEVRVGKAGQPVAIKTHFGWALTGSIASLTPTDQHHVMHIHRSTSQEDELNELLQNWWKTDSFGTSHDLKTETSHEDRRAIRILEDTTRLQDDGHFECGLLWKKDEVSLPENRIGALRRLERTEKSLRSNPDKAKGYKQAIDSYVSLGHARKLGQDEAAKANPKRWYLPHHAVFNQNKPGKIRVVFDASAEFHGTSLNEELLTGPDLLQELPAILMRFREKSVAIVGDIDQMFHQVRIQQSDRPALSFLWRDLECGRPPDTYEMNVAIFGAKCSPAIASYALRKVIESQVEVGLNKHSASGIAKQFYMDDYVASAESPKSAADLLHTVTKLVSTGGFTLRKWTSSPREVMESVQPTDRAHSELDAFTPLSSERVLGLIWDTEQDTIGLNVPKKRNLPTTKRGILKAIAAVYDPLGLLSPFMLQAKLLMQGLWRQQLTWDSQLDEQDLHRWRCWQEEANILSQLRISRCYTALDGPVKRSELHVFSDASEAAFGAAGYLRQIDATGAIQCALVMSRTRVAPLKQLTVVRLELQGAVLATRRWRHSQQIADHFWRRWTREYLPTLIGRQKWTKDTRNIQIDDVVLVAESNVPRGRWPLARVAKVFPGSDGRVRSVELNTPSGTYVRPVVRLCVLEESE
ncbi:uncharacterized protein LOC122372869 [Amphibalanus amphitrite]|uniref:uncharacterized protein LOC122372869 n=1 Tax=Amphibalanus amphitrite TaxID=1232801 RepID=UPI001C90E783|nr:uncharacterized protein LOC122372869 [Amphibalanus amphitrite]